MNNSYFLYAERVKKNKYGVFSNILFLEKELWKFDKAFVLERYLMAIPLLVHGYIGNLMPALVVGGLEQKKSPAGLLIPVLLAGLLLFGSNTAYDVMNKCANAKRQFLNFYIARRFLDKALEIDYELQERADYRETYSNAWSSAGNARGFYEGSLLTSTLIWGALGIGIYGYILGSRSVIVLLLVLACVGMNLYLLSVARKVHKKYYGRISKYAKGVGYISEITMDSAAGKDIRIYRMLDFILKKYDENLEQMGKNYGKIHNWYLFRSLTGAVFDFLRDAAAYLYLVRELSLGRISAAEFVFLIGVITTLADYFENVLRGLMQWNTLDASVTYFRDFLDTDSIFVKESKVDPAILENLKKGGLEVELKDVTFTYDGAAEPVVSHFNLTIRSGEKLALIGLNGAGKTTLVKLICGLYTPDSGTITVNGIDRSEFTKEEYTSLVSVMFQDAYFLPVSLDENITGEEEPDRGRLEKALEVSGFAERYGRLPQKGRSRLIKKLEKEAVDFSGGEKQKLIFARAIYRKTPLMILDEPTAALDPIAEHEMYCNFKEAVGDSTTIYISHRLSSTRFCDRVILIENGSIIEEGTHEGLLAKNGRYAELFELQSKYYREEQRKKDRLRAMEEGEENNAEGE